MHMILNGLVVSQANDIFMVHNVHGGMIAQLRMPVDGQTLADYKAMEAVTKMLAYRWGIKSAPVRTSRKK